MMIKARERNGDLAIYASNSSRLAAVAVLGARPLRASKSDEDEESDEDLADEDEGDPNEDKTAPRKKIALPKPAPAKKGTRVKPKNPKRNKPVPTKKGTKPAPPMRPAEDEKARAQSEQYALAVFGESSRAAVGKKHAKVSFDARQDREPETDAERCATLMGLGGLTPSQLKRFAQAAKAVATMPIGPEVDELSPHQKDALRKAGRL